MSCVLLDSGVLIALAFDEHVFHPAVDEWFGNLNGDFATCPITQGSVVRTVVRSNAPAARAVELLRQITTLDRHVFWADEIGYDGVDLSRVMGHRQVTDAYLAGLARHKRGRVATLDIGMGAAHPDVADLIPVGF